MLRPEPLRIAQLMDLPLMAGQLPYRCPVRGAYRLVDILGVPEARLSEWGLSLLGSSHRMAALGATETERIYRAASAWLMAERVFADAGKAQRFLNGPHPFLSGRSPMDVAWFDEGGLQSVKELLGRLYFGTAA